MATGAYVSDDVPFSCCDPFSHRPCLHHHVHQNDKHFNYDWKGKVTVYTKGCRQALMEFFADSLLTTSGGIVLGMGGLMVKTLLCTEISNEKNV